MDSVGVQKSDRWSDLIGPEIGPEESRPRDNEGSLYCVCSRHAHFHSLGMVHRERVFPHECGATNAPLRVNDCQFALGFESANLRAKTMGPRNVTQVTETVVTQIRLFVAGARSCICNHLPGVCGDLLHLQPSQANLARTSAIG